MGLRKVDIEAINDILQQDIKQLKKFNTELKSINNGLIQSNGKLIEVIQQYRDAYELWMTEQHYKAHDQWKIELEELRAGRKQEKLKND
jgi:hypothetical protein